MSHPVLQAETVPLEQPLPAPVAILLLGIGGVGKSTTAPLLRKLLESRGHNVTLIWFDELRKSLTPPGADPFTSDPSVKQEIYQKAAELFSEHLRQGRTLVIDSGLSVERIRRDLKQRLEQLRIVHIHCPLWVAVYRDTKRSWRDSHHERGNFLHLRALADFFNPFKKDKFPQPGITYPFEYPDSADVHISSFLKSPSRVAEEILTRLSLSGDAPTTVAARRTAPRGHLKTGQTNPVQ